MQKLYKQSLSIFLFTLIITISSHVQAKANFRIFACEPEWASLAQEIGGEKVNIKLATNAFQDPHHIRARPSLIAAIRKSNLVVCTGGELEIGWLPILLKKSGNVKIQPNMVGYFMASDFINKLEVPKIIDRSLGDIHASGNPHIHLNPYNISIIAKRLVDRLMELDPHNSEYYQNNFDKFKTKWDKAITRWEAQALPLNGKNIIVQHSSWVYLTTWLHLQSIATLEPKPGIPPSVSHLKTVLSEISRKHADFIMLANFENSKPSKWFSQKTNIPMVILPFTVGGNKQVTDLESLFDDILKKLLAIQ